MSIFIYGFGFILQGSKFINVTAFIMVNIYLCLLFGNLHTNKNIVAFCGTCITINLLDCDVSMGMSYGCLINLLYSPSLKLKILL